MTSVHPIEQNVQAPDASEARRPGVPKEHAPSPVPNAHWLVPDQQQPRDDVLMDPRRTSLTATFSAANAPHGLSGLLRRAAYRIPDYYARRWALLLFADRVDAVESRLTGAFKSREEKS